MTADAALTDVLGATPPETVRALPDATLERLTEQVRAAKERLDAETDESVRKAIAGVPFAVRGIVKKALLG
ncbi:MAG: hypothetical protein ACJ72E_06335 [Marmoricola sp.]